MSSIPKYPILSVAVLPSNEEKLEESSFCFIYLLHISCQLFDKFTLYLHLNCDSFDSICIASSRYVALSQYRVLTKSICRYPCCILEYTRK
jgi:hypothetical protein